MPSRESPKQTKGREKGGCKSNGNAKPKPKPKAKPKATPQAKPKAATPKHLYHYTDASGAKAIAKSGHLRASKRINGDCALGEGTYFTSKPPQTSTHNLLTNNYGRETRANMPKAQAYVRVDAASVKAKSGCKQLGRDVYVVPGNGVSLASVSAKIGQRKRYSRDAQYTGQYSK